MMADELGPKWPAADRAKIQRIAEISGSPEVSVSGNDPVHQAEVP
jgi:hypothetical protein